jgi:hypothetical protein
LARFRGGLIDLGQKSALEVPQKSVLSAQAPAREIATVIA